MSFNLKPKNVQSSLFAHLQRLLPEHNVHVEAEGGDDQQRGDEQRDRLDELVFLLELRGPALLAAGAPLKGNE